MDPVATPWSTTPPSAPRLGIRAVSPRNPYARLASSAGAAPRCHVQVVGPAGGPHAFSLITRTPPSPITPIPSSGWWGTPSLRTTTTSSRACKRERDLERHRYAAPRQADHDDVLVGPLDGAVNVVDAACGGTVNTTCASKVPELGGQPTAGISTIDEVHRHPLASVPLSHL